MVACRYWYELSDGFWGQFMLSQIPHQYASDLLPQTDKQLESMQIFAGMIEYCRSWRWVDARTISAKGGIVFSVDSLPVTVDDEGVPDQVGVYASLC